MFGPILHVRFAGDRLEQMIDAINATGYGLTLGVHSRIDQTVDLVLERARAGNIYVNRNMIGAVVGVQPFGGEGLSGTGPKAGGPHYLARFAAERTVSVNTAAVGGNASLLSLDADLAPANGPPDPVALDVPSLTEQRASRDRGTAPHAGLALHEGVASAAGFAAIAVSLWRLARPDRPRLRYPHAPQR